MCKNCAVLERFVMMMKVIVLKTLGLVKLCCSMYISELVLVFVNWVCLAMQKISGEYTVLQVHLKATL